MCTNCSLLRFSGQCVVKSPKLEMGWFVKYGEVLPLSVVHSNRDHRKEEKALFRNEWLI